MDDRLVIERRYRGPESSGNGGWTCGALAQHVDGPAEVTLRRPPPLDTPLTIETADGISLLREPGGEVVAEATAGPAHVDPPPFVSADEAIAAGRRFLGHDHHEFPQCFTCGTSRAEGDGLRVFAGPVDGRPDLVATTWTPSAAIADAGGAVPDPIVWAALDCPSVWPYLGDGTRALLGRMAATVDRLPEVGRTYVVVGQGTGSEGRKRFGAAAIYTVEGELVAASRTTWITVDA